MWSFEIFECTEEFLKMNWMILELWNETFVLIFTKKVFRSWSERQISNELEIYKFSLIFKKSD